MFARYKKWRAERQEKKVQTIWNKRDDDGILLAYVDADEWLNVDENFHRRLGHGIPDSLKDDLHMRLVEYILPQMRIRGMDYDPKYDLI